MHTRDDHGAATAIPDGSQQPYCPPGTLWGPGHDANRVPRSPQDTVPASTLFCQGTGFDIVYGHCSYGSRDM